MACNCVANAAAGAKVGICVQALSTAVVHTTRKEAVTFSMMRAPSCFGSPSEVQTFLRGTWALRKTLRYDVGGATATWEGNAKFTDVSVTGRGPVLLYSEEGNMTIEGVAKPLITFRHYAFAFDRPDVEVYFVDDFPKVDCSRLFHHLSLEPSSDESSGERGLREGGGISQSYQTAACSFEHLCINDLYQGDFRVTSEGSFEWDWRITGPKKDGRIRQWFTRVDANALQVDATR